MKRHGHTFARFAVLLAMGLAALPQPVPAQEGVRRARSEDIPEPVLTRPPELLQFVPATYPEQAMQEGREADVVLAIEIDATGAVVNVTVVQGAPGGFDEAAVAAARAFRFQAAEVDGQPAPVIIEYAYRFRLEKKVVPPPDGAAAAVLKGRTRERGTGLPVIGAEVTVVGQERRALTNEKGAYSLTGIDPGTYRLKVVAPSYQDADADVEIKPDLVTEVDFFLRPLEDNPYETVVRGEREQDVVARYSLAERTLTTVPGTFGDPLRVVQNLPGFARSPYAIGLLLVRGSYPGESTISVDGVQVPLIYHFLGGPSILSPEFLQRIDFYPGNFPVKYGNALAGVIEVETASDMPEVMHGSADVNLFFAGGFFEAPLSDKVSLKLGLRRSYYDLVIPLVLKAAGGSGTSVVPVYYDYQARLDVALRGDDRLHILAFGSDDQLDLATTDDQTKNQIDIGTQTSFHRILARHLWHLSPNVTSTMAPYVGLDVQSLSYDEGSLDTTEFLAGLREDITWKVGPRLEIRPGINAQVQVQRFSSFLPPRQNYVVPGEDVLAQTEAGPPSSVDTTGNKVEVSRTLVSGNVAAYIDAVYKPWDRLTLIPGARFEGWFYLGRTRLAASPRLIARVDVGPDTTIKGGAGLFFRPPTAFRIDPDYGNPDLALEWSEQYSLGFEHRFTSALTLDLQGFFLRRHDKASRTDAYTVTDEGLKPQFYNNDGWGRAYGMELLLKHDVTRYFYGWLSYTLSRAEEERTPGLGLSPTAFDQTHIMNLVASFRLGRGWEVGARFRLVSGNPETPVKDGTFVADSNGYLPTLGARLSTRKPLFHQLDIRVEKTWEFERWMLSVYLDLQNVYYAKNVEFVTWDYRYNKSYDIQGLPILPTLGIKGQF